MHGRSGIRALVGLAVLAVFSFLAGAAPGGASATQSPPPPPVVPGALPPEVDPPSEYVVVQYATPMRAQAVGDSPAPILEEQGFERLRVPDGMTPGEFIAQLRNDPDIVSAQEDARVYAQAIPDDLYYLRDQSHYFSQIGAPAGWDLMNQSRDVVVAVLDSGVDVRHPEFAGRLWENPRDANSDGIDSDGNGCIDDRYGCRFVQFSTANRVGCGYTEGSSVPNGAILDDHGSASLANHSHGTIVAGIVGAGGNNGQGIAGASWNVKIMSVKVLDCGPGGTLPSGYISDIAAGIKYAVHMGADIINLSVASNPNNQNADAPVLRQAIEEALAKGVIIVAAAGNHSSPTRPSGPGYPAAYTQYPNVIAVGAANSDNTWASYSAAGPALDFAAPGNGLVGTVRTDIGYSAPYGTAGEGTSFATPLVTGLFALMKARNPALTLEEYVQLAREGATPAPPAPHGQNWAGAGIVNYGGALKRVPATLTGNALHDWKDVAAGTTIVATVDGKVCGSTTTTMVGPASRYLVQVMSDGQKAGCGAPGRSIMLTVGGQPSQPTIPWGGQNVSLTYVNTDVSSVSPPPGPIVVQPLNAGWSNVAHLDADGALPGALNGLSASWGTVFRWDPAKTLIDRAGAYRRFIKSAPGYANDLGSLERYEAFWIDASAANIATVNPEPVAGRSVDLQPGWNSVVWTGPASEVATALSGIAGEYSRILHYDNTSGTWRSYIPGQVRFLQDFNGLFQFKVYWIYATQPARLTM
ncbi:MAG: S8 family serine peptidase [Dehalococcoidia bacterium]|nr:S8 family serine peptidase [Dehalococcoidia bacterium]